MILPLLGEYSDSGFRDPQARFAYSLRVNVRYQLIVLACGTAGLVYFLLNNGLRGSSIKGLVVALAYAWGLALAIWLMGHGLVSLPKAVFRHASPQSRLRILQTKAPKAHDNMSAATVELQELEATALQLKRTKSHGRYKEWIEELADSSDMVPSRAASAAFNGTTGSSTSIPAVVTDRYLADLTRKLKRARHRRIRFIEEWDSLVREATDAQAILDASSSQRLDAASLSSSTSRWRILDARSRFYLHYYLIPAARFTLSAILALASVALVFTEFANPLYAPYLSIVNHTVIPPSRHPSFFNQLIAAMWLSYMCISTLYAISAVPIWGNRALVPRRTYAESATWYAGQVAKLTIPLSFNFMQIINPDVVEQTAFHQFIGKLIDLTPVTGGFNRFFPMIIVLPVAAAMFNLYGKVKSTLGFGVLEDDEGGEFGTSWREGRALIESDRLDRPAGGSADALGLGVSRSERDIEREPLTHAPSSTSTSSINPSAAREYTAPEPRRSQATSSTVTLQDHEDTNFFQDFQTRVKNTFETSNFPKIQKPKWLQGLAGEESSARADFGGGLGRWFGGRPADGNVRL